MHRKELIDDITYFLSQRGFDNINEQSEIVMRIYDLLIINKPSMLQSKFATHNDYDKYHTWPC